MAALGGSLALSQAMGLAGRRGIPFLELICRSLGGLSCSGSAVVDPYRSVPALCESSSTNLSDGLRVLSTPTLDVEWMICGFPALHYPAVRNFVENDPLHKAEFTQVLASDPYHGFFRFVKPFSSGSLANYFAPGCFLPSMIVQAGRTGWDKNWSGSVFSKMNVICYGSCAGILLFNSISSKDSSGCPPGHGSRRSDDIQPDDPKDPLKEILRLLREVFDNSTKILLNTTPAEPKKAWLIQIMEGFVGPAVTSRVVYCVKLLKNQWDQFYFFICYGLACISLNVGPVQCCLIIRHYLLERQETAQKVLAALARDAQKKEDDTDSVDALVVSALDLETQDVRQVIFFLRGRDSAAVLSFLDGFAMSRPLVPESTELNNLILLLKGKDNEVMLSLLKKLAKSQPRVPKGTKPLLPKGEGQSPN